jgi:integrase
MAKRKIRKRQYGSGSIFRRGGSSTFIIKFRDKNRDIITKSGFATKELAETALANELAFAQINCRIANHVPTLSVLFAKWIKIRTITHENHYNDSLRWKRHLEPIIGNMTPDQVTPDTVKNIIDAKFSEGLSSGSVGLITSLLSSIYSDLVEGPFATSNPVKKLPKKTKRTLKSDHDPENVPFLRNLEEVGMVFAALPDDLKVPFAVGVYSGLRSGEIFGLDWSNVDLKARKIRVVQQITAGELKLRPKDGESRTTIIPNALATILENRRVQTGGVGLLFKYVTSAKLNETLQDVLASLGLNPNMTWYQSTRHSFASLWVLNGGSLEVLQKLMGHSSILVTQRYAHLKIDEFSQADLGRMDIAA